MFGIGLFVTPLRIVCGKDEYEIEGTIRKKTTGGYVLQWYLNPICITVHGTAGNPDSKVEEDATAVMSELGCMACRILAINSSYNETRRS